MIFVLKVIAACGSGMGSSQIIKMKLNKIFKKLGIDARIEHTSIGIARTQASSYDVVFCSENFKSTFAKVSNNTIIVPLKNLLSEQEIEEKINSYILNKDS